MQQACGINPWDKCLQMRSKVWLDLDFDNLMQVSSNFGLRYCYFIKEHIFKMKQLSF